MDFNVHHIGVAEDAKLWLADFYFYAIAAA
jgi:hypothetical protein